MAMYRRVTGISLFEYGVVPVTGHPLAGRRYRPAVTALE